MPVALPNYPEIGDRLWALLGIPWLATALVQSAAPSSEPRPQSLVHDDFECRSGHRLPDRAGRRLEHVGHGPSRASRADRGGSVDQPRRTDSIDRLADPMRTGHGRLELTGTCMHSDQDLAFSSSSRTSWRWWSATAWRRSSFAHSGRRAVHPPSWDRRDRALSLARPGDERADHPVATTFASARLRRAAAQRPLARRSHTWAELAWLLIGAYWIVLGIIRHPSTLARISSWATWSCSAWFRSWSRWCFDCLGPGRRTEHEATHAWTHTAAVVLLATWPVAWICLIVLGKTLR